MPPNEGGTRLEHLHRLAKRAARRLRPSLIKVLRAGSEQILDAKGLRYRVHYSIRVNGDRPISVDLAFTRVKLAVFVDGCFWHACPVHGSMPKANADYWPQKLRGNVDRDQLTTRRLQLAGWHVARFWEHEDLSDVATRILALRQRREGQVDS
jgi:DNA mismatch endonuclease (patch repair protein)